VKASPWDREIARLAVPALGALTAEPLYILVDTAIVGHLGTPQLGGLAVAASVLLTVNYICVFLAYGTTAAVARLLGAGDDRAAAHQAVQGLWLAGGLGVALAAVGWPLAGPLVRALADSADVAAQAEIYLRLSLPGVPAILLVLAGTGYLRGLQDTRTPLVVAVGAAALNLVLELVVVYGLDRGIGASAVATVVAQWCAAAVYLRSIGRSASAVGVGLRPDLAALRRLLVVAGALVVRTGSLRAAWLIGTAVAARIGTDDLGAHQITYELWGALALALDAIAIAGQALIGRLLGAGDVDGARAAGRRMLELALAAGVAAAVLVVALRPVLPGLFTDDPAVLGLTGFLLWWLAATQPVTGLVSVLDGLLIGAGDLRYLARAMVFAAAVFAAGAGAVLGFDLGIGWLWAAISLFLLARAGPLLARWKSGRWAVVGATR
jgi:putative MATE family efflux protein